MQIERLDRIFNYQFDLWTDEPSPGFPSFGLLKQRRSSWTFAECREQAVEISTPDAQLARCFIHLESGQAGFCRQKSQRLAPAQSFIEQRGLAIVALWTDLQNGASILCRDSTS